GALRSPQEGPLGGENPARGDLRRRQDAAGHRLLTAADGCRRLPTAADRSITLLMTAKRVQHMVRRPHRSEHAHAPAPPAEALLFTDQTGEAPCTPRRPR